MTSARHAIHPVHFTLTHPTEAKIKQSGDVDLILPVSNGDQGGNSVSLSLACIGWMKTWDVVNAELVCGCCAVKR